MSDGFLHKTLNNLRVQRYGALWLQTSHFLFFWRGGKIKFVPTFYRLCHKWTKTGLQGAPILIFCH